MDQLKWIIFYDAIWENGLVGILLPTNKHPSVSHPVVPYRFTEYKIRRKSHPVQEPMKKGEICSIRFHKFKQIEATNEHTNFLACAETYARKRLTRTFFEKI